MFGVWGILGSNILTNFVIVHNFVLISIEILKDILFGFVVSILDLDIIRL